MKTILMSLVTFTMLNFGFALTPPPATLGKTMKAMSADLKKISAQVNKVNLNGSSAILADDFTQLALHAKIFTPETVRSLPNAQQPAAKSRFDQRLDHVAVSGKQLAEAFRAGNNADAVLILKELDEQRKDGHDEFKP